MPTWWKTRLIVLLQVEDAQPELMQSLFENKWPVIGEPCARCLRTCLRLDNLRYEGIDAEAFICSQCLRRSDYLPDQYIEAETLFAFHLHGRRQYAAFKMQTPEWFESLPA